MRRSIVAVALVSQFFWNWIVLIPVRADNTPKTATPIQHLVILFDENESFDHYFGTYPVAHKLRGAWDRL